MLRLIFNQSPIVDPAFPTGKIVMTANFEHTLGQEFKAALPLDQTRLAWGANVPSEADERANDQDHFTDSVGGGNYLMYVVMSALGLHLKGDWGECCEEDGQANDYALKNGERLMSVYTTAAMGTDDGPKYFDALSAAAVSAITGTKFWVITEWDRSVTTFLLPEDY
jgi:hypothetical protein